MKRESIFSYICPLQNICTKNIRKINSLQNTTICFRQAVACWICSAAESSGDQRLLSSKSSKIAIRFIVLIDIIIAFARQTVLL